MRRRMNSFGAGVVNRLRKLAIGVGSLHGLRRFAHGVGAVYGPRRFALDAVAIRRLRRFAIAALVLAAIWLAIATVQDLQPLPATLEPEISAEARARFLDRNGVPLNASYADDWNLHEQLALHEIPQFLRQAFIHAEDKRFFEHDGADWAARFNALVTNLRHLDRLRGASTITEQAVRMLHPRPRTVWSRWLEGFAAAQLERRLSKDGILTFYLNQVPYASRRRGVQQAAEFYFARDLNTLSDREMLTLAVLVRAPSALDPYRAPGATDAAVGRLAEAMLARGVIDQSRHDAILAEPLELAAARLAVRAPHFLAYAAGQAGASAQGTLVTTLDAALQSRVQNLLDSRVDALAGHGVRHGAALVAANETGEILAWAVAGGADAEGPVTHIDPVTTPRQPGSALKPLLYALALEYGKSLADVIVDAPLTEKLGDGLHRYRNYSERYYGPVTLRDALGNSLNIPALKLLHEVGTGAFLDHLAKLGMTSLREHPDVYGDGLALGNGELTLLELVQAYQALANRGRLTTLSVLRDATDRDAHDRQVVSSESAALIASVLSDPDARALEFGRDSVLNLPVQTAVKTGTSSDYRDAWVVGFDARYTVGIWMGDLDQTPTRGVTGSIGPGLLLRSVLAELNRDGGSRPLYLSPQLVRRATCVPSPQAAAGQCLHREEWFDPAHGSASETVALAQSAVAEAVRLRQPTPGLELAFDPRLPATAQAYRFLLDGVAASDRVEWTIDGDTRLANGDTLIWPVTRGSHAVAATVHRAGIPIAEIPPVEFRVR